jgi:hypothetical protein
MNASTCSLALLATLLAATCGGRRAEAGVVAESTYVQIMARLSLADSLLAPADYEPPAGLSRDSARALVLGRWGVPDSALEAFADGLGEDPGRLKDVWTRIRSLADSLARSGWSPLPEEER